MTFKIAGIKYTVTNVEGNLIHAFDDKGNKRMYNTQYLLKDGITFERPKRVMSPRKPMLSDKQYIQTLKDAASGSPEEDGGYDNSKLYDIASSIIYDEALKNTVIKKYKEYYDEYYSENDLIQFLANEIANYE